MSNHVGQEVRPKRPTPTKGDVDDAFFDINTQARNDMKGSAAHRETSRLWVFLSGHGMMPADGEGALLMANATAQRLGENIELRAYTDWQVKTGIFREVVMFADCCRNWEIQAPRGLPPSTLGEPAGRVHDVVGYAADQNQLSRKRRLTSLAPTCAAGSSPGRSSTGCAAKRQRRRLGPRSQAHPWPPTCGQQLPPPRRRSPSEYRSGASGSTTSSWPGCPSRHHSRSSSSAFRPT